jgi:hypothetical protein
MKQDFSGRNFTVGVGCSRGPVHVEFVAERVELGRIVLPFISQFPVAVIPPMFHTNCVLYVRH